ncbi:MAG: hypothetical protein ABW204_01340, partial [Microbacteriaceae bacterium]
MTLLNPALLAPSRPAARAAAASPAQSEAFGSALDAAVRTQGGDRAAVRDGQQPQTAAAAHEGTEAERSPTQRMHAP